MRIGDSDHPLIMGILNVTPDSFSDGGRFATVDLAVAHAKQMLEEGADILDVGGESTRPGSTLVPADEQRRRVVPVIRAIREQLGEDPILSVDTRLADVAEAALDAGANMINDVAAALNSVDMLALAAERDVPLVLMHMQGTPQTMQENPVYGDVAEEVCAFLSERAAAAIAAGISHQNIVLDPGIGFGKSRQHNIDLLAALPRLAGLGFPVLLGTSRKRFMGSLCGESEPVRLLGATCATTTFGVFAGVRVFRVHDVRPNRQAADVAWALLPKKP
ncbi:MAG: dihydropteroate synthase [Anaerolineae bacterium]|nr:dihydropteroate synthase [Anaerolineae bacterium]